jgi:hypothetical protein
MRCAVAVMTPYYRNYVRGVKGLGNRYRGSERGRDDPLPTVPNNESRVDDEDDHRDNSVVDAQLTLAQRAGSRRQTRQPNNSVVDAQLTLPHNEQGADGQTRLTNNSVVDAPLILPSRRRKPTTQKSTGATPSLMRS